MDGLPMSELTRDLLPMAAARLAMFTIILNYSTKVFANEGHYNLTPAPQSVQADVIDLSDDEIQRLQDGGITVNNGIKITLYFEITSLPDTITYGLNTYTIIQSVINEGTSVLTCSRKPLGTAVPEAGA